jgi:putative ABC transport system permease protein
MELYKSGNDPDDTFDIQLVGYDPVIGLGGPLEVIAGKKAPGPDEIIIDEETSERYDVHIADRIINGTKALTVAGIARGGDFVYTQVAFVTINTAVNFIDLEPTTLRTFILLTLTEPENRDNIAKRLEAATPGAKYVAPEDFADETRSRILGNILPILIVVLVVAFIVGLSVAGLTIYTATVEKSREYGILKAEGFTNPFLYRVVFEQSMITGILGFLIGAGLTVLVAPFAQDSVPQFVVFVRWQDILGIAGVTLLMALIAAYIPVRRIASIDPVTVFKG